MTETPVIFFVFNRPAQTRAVFKSIADTKPRKLLVVADGPRDTHLQDKKLCEEVLSIVQNINWPCELSTNFSPTNLGCRQRVITGLNWAFSSVDEAIILEDDCLPVPTFFQYCGELLARYRDDSRVGMISGNNFVSPFRNTDSSYYFSRLLHAWGWATWRRAWKLYDPHLEHWDTIRDNGLLAEVFSRKSEIEYWTYIFQSMRDGTGPDTWDYQWSYTALVNNLLSVVPEVNLVRNLGFGPDATHTKDGSAPTAVTSATDLVFPLRHPPSMIAQRSFDEFEHERSQFPTWQSRVRAQIRSGVSQLVKKRGFVRQRQLAENTFSRPKAAAER